jgi:hypothetical protein
MHQIGMHRKNVNIYFQENRFREKEKKLNVMNCVFLIYIIFFRKIGNRYVEKLTHYITYFYIHFIFLY